jgi:hypothetical protein
MDSNSSSEEQSDAKNDLLLITAESGGHKRSLSGSILSKLSFLRASADDDHSPGEGSEDQVPPSLDSTPGEENTAPKKSGRAMAVAVQQQKTRRRKGSLRKAALLGRGAQRERKDTNTQVLDTSIQGDYNGGSYYPTSPEQMHQRSSFGLGISEATPRPSMDEFANRANNTALSSITTLPMGIDEAITSPTTTTSPTLTYTSTTDEEDILSFATHNVLQSRPLPPNSSGSDSYFAPGSGSVTRRRSQRSKSPLAPSGLSGLATSSLPPADEEWDYSETEWWGWVILAMTWIVFVTGMGSCLGVWSWAWDVGETPYAPPELEDDPTLPIVGYYPALIILTSVMAWVWVVVAWVGMKYFRHAKISGD